MPVNTEEHDYENAEDEFWPSINKDLAVIHRLLDSEESTSCSDLSSDLCPVCRMPFDKGRKRKLIDACGHERCYSCMFKNEICPLCAANSQVKQSKKSAELKRRSYEEYRIPDYADVRKPTSITSGSVQQRPKVKTNGHFSSLMQSRYNLEDDCNCKNMSPDHLPKPNRKSEPPLSAVLSASKAQDAQTPQPRRKPFSPKHVKNSMWSFRSASRLSGSAHSDDESTSAKQVPPINRTSRRSSQQDLYMRLGLLLGDNVTSTTASYSSSTRRNSSISVSSLASLDATNFPSSNTSPVSTLTGSSENDAHRTVKDPSSDSVGSLMSMSGHSNCSSSPLSRRHSVTTSQPGQIEELSLFKNRRCSVRRSARSGIIKGPIDPKIRFAAEYRTQQQQFLQPPKRQTLLLKPLFFEVPLQEADPVLVGRDWLMKELDTLTAASNPGVLITGYTGTGKTAFLLQLVEYSCFGRRREPSYKHADVVPVSDVSSQHSIYCQVNLVSSRIKDLASRVVAYHFCQADNNVTCAVPDFVHSIAAQLCQAPQLAEYRDYLLSETYLQSSLSMRECISDPDVAFIRGVLEPLSTLEMSEMDHSLLILVDALCEAEYHKPDHGDTISSFLAKHSPSFPPWLKVIATVTTHIYQVLPVLPYKRISLDITGNHADNVQKDLLDYIHFRVNNSPSIQSNLVTGAAGQYRFVQHLQALCRGSFLFAKLTLDLFERGHLVAKSTSFKVLPVTLAQIYLLHFNLRFPTESAYQKVSSILSVALAALYPLTLSEIYYSINCLNGESSLSWEEFLQKFKLLSEFLVKRMDNTYMFFHPSFREWLIKRDEGESTKFLCDVKSGHAAIAFRLSRLESPLDADKTLELGHHILKAHLHKDVTVNKYSSTDLQSCWMVSISDNISEALCALRNVYSPNIKVSRLLLLSGASPNHVSNLLGQAPALCLFAHEGVTEMMSLLLEFGAEVDSANNQGCTALILAAAKGHEEVVKKLVSAGAVVGKTDIAGRCALIHAARNNHVDVVSYLLSCDWINPAEPLSVDNNSVVELSEASQQSLVVAAGQNNIQIVECLLDTNEVDIDREDTLTGETALTAAAATGSNDVCSLLLSRGCRISSSNRKGFTSLMLASREGHWATVELLLQNRAVVEQRQENGKTALMMAAAEGHVDVLQLLLENGGSVKTEDSEGMTALCWACMHSRVRAVECLIEHNSDINHPTKSGRTPLDLASFQGNPNLVQLLMEKGAAIEHADMEGVRPLDRAVAYRNIPVVQCFLKKGAKLGPTTWNMAAGKLDVMLVLLNKLLEDGNVLYRKGRLREAAHRYSYALNRFQPIPELDTTFTQLRVNFLLNYSRCKRKMEESGEAIELATEVLKLKPDSFEAFYARAKAKMDLQLFTEALSDIHEALMVLPPQNRELRRILLKLRDEIKGAPNSASTNTLNTPTETPL